MRDLVTFEKVLLKGSNLTNMLHLGYIYVNYVSFMKHLKKGELL
jgi:hypothetical protein